MWAPRDLLLVNLTNGENIPIIFQITVLHQTVLCGKLALRSIFLSCPLQNSNAVHVPIA